MAGRDDGQFSELLSTVSSGNDTVNALLQAVANSYEPLTLLEPESLDDAYAQTVDTPIYEPSGPQPEIAELSDRNKADELLREIRDAGLPCVKMNAQKSSRIWVVLVESGVDILPEPDESVLDSLIVVDNHQGRPLHQSLDVVGSVGVVVGNPLEVEGDMPFSRI